MREGLLHLRRHGEIEVDAFRRDGRSEPFGIKRCHLRAGIEFGGCPVDNGLVGAVKRVMPARDIVRELVEEAEQLLRRSH